MSTRKRGNQDSQSQKRTKGKVNSTQTKQETTNTDEGMFIGGKFVAFSKDTGFELAFQLAARPLPQTLLNPTGGKR